MQLTALDVVVVVYMALLSGIGIYFSRRQASREEYLLGGRSMHWMLLGGSMMATLLSTITFGWFPCLPDWIGLGRSLGLPLSATTQNFG